MKYCSKKSIYRILSVVLILSMLGSMMPLSAFAADETVVHAADCSYVQAIEGHDCEYVHEHNAECGYVAATEEIACDMNCVDTDDDGKIDHDVNCAYTPATEGSSCTDAHEHDADCGYVAAVEGVACDCGAITYDTTAQDLDVAVMSDVITPTTSGTCGDTADNNGENVTWSFNADTNTLTISGNGAMISTSAADYPWSVSGCAADVLYLVVEDGVTSVGASAFSNCNSMISATIAGSVKRIEYQAFYGTWGLNSLVLNEGLEYIGAGNFTWNSGLTELNIPSTVTEINTLARINASKLAAINVAAGNTVYSSYKGALYDVDGTTLLLVPCGMTSLELASTVDSFTGTVWVANSGTSQLNEVSIAAGNTNYQLYDNVIYNADGTETIMAPIKKTQSSITFLDSLKTIGTSTFSGGGYTAINIPNSVERINGSAFASLANCVEVTIGEELSSIGEWIFRGCKSIELINYNAVSLTATVNRAPFCDNTTAEAKIVIGENVENIGSYVFQGCSVGEIDFSGASSLTTIGSFVFCGKKTMTELTIPQTITSLGSGAFSGDFTNSATIYYNATAATAAANTNGNNTIFKGTNPNVKVVIGSNVESLPNNLFGGNVIAIDATQIKDTLRLVSNGVTFDYMPVGSTIYVDTAAQATVFATEKDDSFVLVLNGGTFADDITFTANTLTTPEKDGFIFDGWYDNAAFTGTAVENPTTGATYYAKWKQVDGIEITTEPTDKEYTVFETFDTTNMVVAVSYDDDTTGDEITDYTVSYNSGSAFAMGDTSITITATVDGTEYTTTVTDITVAQAAALTFADIPVTQKCTNTESQTVDLALPMPDNAGTVSYMVGTPNSTSGSASVSGYSVTDGTLAYTITGGTTGEVVTIPVTISSTNYEDSTVNVVVTLTDLDIQNALTVTSAATMVYGETLDLAVTGGTTDGEVTYILTNGTGSATINEGVLTATGVGTVTITATMAGDETYANVSVNQTITIEKADQTAIAFTSGNNVAVADTLTLVTTSNNEVSGDATYSLADGDTAATLSEGVLTGVSVGMVTITATKAGDDNYNDVTASMTIFVLASDADTVTTATALGAATITTPDVSGKDFTIVVAETISDSDKNSFTVPSGYTEGETFHLYALVDNIVVEDATFSETITVTIPYDVVSGKIYKVLHQKQDGSIETLTAIANVSAQTLCFSVSELSPFMVVSKSMSSSSNTSSSNSVVVTYPVVSGHTNPQTGIDMFADTM